MTENMKLPAMSTSQTRRLQAIIDDTRSRRSAAHAADIRGMVEKASALSDGPFTPEDVEHQAEALVRFAFRSLGHEIPPCLR